MEEIPQHCRHVGPGHTLCPWKYVTWLVNFRVFPFTGSCEQPHLRSPVDAALRSSSESPSSQAMYRKAMGRWG